MHVQFYWFIGSSNFLNVVQHKIIILCSDSKISVLCSSNNFVQQTNMVKIYGVLMGIGQEALRCQGMWAVVFTDRVSVKRELYGLSRQSSPISSTVFQLKT